MQTAIVATDMEIQRQLVSALCESLRGRGKSAHLRLVETHISWIVLAGHDAYKIKKAVNLGFLDFSTLAARLHFCEEELRVNRRLAPEIYLEIVAVGGSPQQPVLGQVPALEYAVKMRRFAQNRGLDRLAARKRLQAQHIDSLARTVAAFHQAAAVAARDAPYASPARVQQDMRQNFSSLQGILRGADDLRQLSALQQVCELEYAACQELVAARKAAGRVRECHGDLHLGNIVLLQQRPVPFDALEFDPALRWIDVVNEIAFTMMDLLHCGYTGFAWRFLDKYLECTGDYAGTGLLRFYLAYRALVRAKVSAIRIAQNAPSASAECRSYLQLAADCLAMRCPALIITSGLPGAGKSTFAQLALQRLPAVRIRSDVERKRLFGLPPLASSQQQAEQDIYAADVTERTYAHLLTLASQVLQAGHTVIVDAAFLRQAQRARFHALACAQGVPFVIVQIEAGPDELRRRLIARARQANDPSEADVAVLEKLQLAQEGLTAAERETALTIAGDAQAMEADQASWRSLRQRVMRRL